MNKSNFKVNDDVVYPLHGVGIIDSTYEREINEVKTKFYKIKLKDSEMFISVPLKNAESVGLRKIMDEEDIKQVIRKLSNLPKTIEENWKVRYQENIEKLKSGKATNMATVIKELFLRNRVKSLSIMERKQYEGTYKMLVKEISISKKTDEKEVSNLISSKLDALAKKIEKKEEMEKKEMEEMERKEDK